MKTLRKNVCYSTFLHTHRGSFVDKPRIKIFHIFFIIRVKKIRHINSIWASCIIVRTPYYIQKLQNKLPHWASTSSSSMVERQEDRAEITALDTGEEFMSSRKIVPTFRLSMCLHLQGHRVQKKESMDLEKWESKRLQNVGNHLPINTVSWLISTRWENW